MKLHFKPITPQNRKEAESLCVSPHQKGFVESVRDCLKEADGRKSWRPVGIYDSNQLIGFAMYGFFWEYLPFGRVWLDRILIDRRFQGKGYGKAAMKGLLKRLQHEYRRKKVYLSVYRDNHAAIHLYRELGFRFNGQHDVHGEDVMVYSFPKR